MANLKEKLGAKIQKIRKLKGITQEQLAELIDMDIPNVSNIERGKRFMTAETLEKISKALNVEEKELFTFEQKYSRDELLSSVVEDIKSLKDKELLYLSAIIKNLRLLK